MSIELADTLKQKGNEAFAQNEFKKAAKIYRDAIKLNPDNPVLYSNRAICFIKLNDFERALKDCNSGLQLSKELKTTVKLLYRQYLSLTGLGSFEKSREALEKAKQLDPNNKLIIDALQKLSTSKEVLTRTSNLKKIDIIRVDEIPPEFSVDKGLAAHTTNTLVPNAQEKKTAHYKSNDLLDDPPEDWRQKHLRFFNPENSTF